TFRIARRLLNRLDDPDTGRLLLPEFAADIPGERLAQARRAGDILGDAVWRQFPWVGCDHAPDGQSTAQLHAMPTTTDPVECILTRTWRGALSVTGAANLPGIANAGNVLRPKTSLKLSLRLPPTVHGDSAAEALKRV